MLYRDYYVPMLPGGYYHIFTRGNNKDNVFYQTRNYGYFLEKYKKYAAPWLDTFAYCLLPNHFHLLVRVKEAAVFWQAKKFWQYVAQDQSGFQNLTGLKPPQDQSGLPDLTGLTTPLQDLTPQLGKHEAEFYQACTAFISEQFRLLFMSYAKAINKQEGRTGSLFEKPFKRLAVEADSHFGHLVYYIHANAELHRLVSDFRKYPHSSYHAYLSAADTNLKREHVIQWFGSKDKLVKEHTEKIDLQRIAYLLFDED